MASDEKKRQRTEIGYRGGRAQQLGENLREGTLEPNVRMFRDQYFQPAASRQMEDYGNIMGQYQDFAKTGGYSGSDLGAIRSRALSPTRAVYGNALRNVNRQRSLQGGYSPGYGTLMSRFAREQGQGLSDAATNAEAQIAQMVNQGKQFGVQGQQSLYGTTPAAAATFGNQVLGATGQLGQGVANEMDLQTQLINAQNQASQLPGKWESTVGRAGQIANIAQGAIYPWMMPGSNAIPFNKMP